MNNQTISLKDLQDLFQNRKKYKLSESKGHVGIGPDNFDGNAGEYNERFEFFSHPGLPEGIFMRITYQTDSYGDNEHMYNVDFVEGKAKTITVYEPI